MFGETVSERRLPPHLPVYQQPQQQQAAQSYGGYKEPAAPASIQRCAPGGGGVSSSSGGQRERSWSWEVGGGLGSLRRPRAGLVDIARRFSLEAPPGRPGFLRPLIPAPVVICR